LRFVGAVPGRKGVEHLIEESRRQEAVIIAIRAADLSKVIARPFELVAFGYNDTRAGVVQSGMALDRSGNFLGAGGIGGSGVRNRQDGDICRLIRLALDRESELMARSSLVRSCGGNGSLLSSEGSPSSSSAHSGRNVQEILL
jgi:hypothetical protein